MPALLFAVDSIPAIFAITSEPLVVFTSNIFAILGLRSMFFLLSGGAVVAQDTLAGEKERAELATTVGDMVAKGI